jgi:Na+/H+ antiporter NhaC
MPTRLNDSNLPVNHSPNPWALTPLVVFLLVYLVVSIIAGDFYKMPITVAFVIASVVAIVLSKGGKLNNRVEQFAGAPLIVTSC